MSGATNRFLVEPRASPVTENCPLSWHCQLSSFQCQFHLRRQGYKISEEQSNEVLRISVHSITPWLVGSVSEGERVLSSLGGE